MSKIAYEMALDSTTTIEVTAIEQTKEVVMYISRPDLEDGRTYITIRMEHLIAERLWHALKGCVDYAVRPEK